VGWGEKASPQLLCSHDASLSLNLLVARTVVVAAGMVSALFMWTQASTKGCRRLDSDRKRERKTSNKQTRSMTKNKQSIDLKLSVFLVFSFMFFFFVCFFFFGAKCQNTGLARKYENKPRGIRKPWFACISAPKLAVRGAK
jgi:hypothetical protein